MRERDREKGRVYERWRRINGREVILVDISTVPLNFIVIMKNSKMKLS
jgi:hypothetical protein